MEWFFLQLFRDWLAVGLGLFNGLAHGRAGNRNDAVDFGLLWQNDFTIIVVKCWSMSVAKLNYKSNLRQI